VVGLNRLGLGLAFLAGAFVRLELGLGEHTAIACHPRLQVLKELFEGLQTVAQPHAAHAPEESRMPRARNSLATRTWP